SAETALGPFEWDGAVWASAPIPVPLFGGVPVTICIFAESEGEDAVLSKDQVEALQKFLSLPQSRAAEIIPHLWAYYQELWHAVGPPELPGISEPTTIWRHVEPRWLLLERDEQGVVHLSIEGECDWEPEHGLQLVLQNGDRWVRVSDCSGHHSPPPGR